MRSTTGFAIGIPLVDISSVFDLASRPTKAQRDTSFISPMVMAYSAQAPTSTFFMSTTNGKPGAMPGPCAPATAGSERTAKARAKAAIRRMEISLCDISTAMRDVLLGLILALWSTLAAKGRPS